MLVPGYNETEFGGDGIKLFQANGLFNNQPVDDDLDGFINELDMDPSDPFFPLYTEATITYRSSTSYNGISAEILDHSFNPSENQVTIVLDLSNSTEADFQDNSTIDWEMAQSQKLRLQMLLNLMW